MMLPAVSDCLSDCGLGLLASRYRSDLANLSMR
jgi:hypothetical protein